MKQKELDITLLTKVGNVGQTRKIAKASSRDVNQVWRATLDALGFAADAADVLGVVEAVAGENPGRAEASLSLIVTEGGRPFVTIPPVIWHNIPIPQAAILMAAFDNSFAKFGIKWDRT